MNDDFYERKTKIALLELHVQEYYKEPGRIPPEKKAIATKRWKTMVYQHWAACEFIRAIKGCSDLYFAAEKFAEMLDDFACKEHKDKQMFSIAYDVAMELTSYLYCL